MTLAPLYLCARRRSSKNKSGDLESPGNPRRIYTITTSGEEAIESMIQTYFQYHQSIQSWYKEIQLFNTKRGWLKENETNK